MSSTPTRPLARSIGASTSSNSRSPSTPRSSSANKWRSRNRCRGRAEHRVRFVAARLVLRVGERFLARCSPGATAHLVVVNCADRPVLKKIGEPAHHERLLDAAGIQKVNIKVVLAPRILVQ